MSRSFGRELAARNYREDVSPLLTVRRTPQPCAHDRTQ
jgi:hypothetical protein